MLTGKLVRVRRVRDQLRPQYIDADDPRWLGVAELLLALVRQHQGARRGQLEAALQETFGDDPTQLIHQGLAKVVEDRCEFETVADGAPEAIRAAVFGAAARQRLAGPADRVRPEFDRGAVLDQAAAELGLTVEQVEAGLFADLRSEQRLIRFKDLSPGRLLHRYNVALAQAVLLRSTGVTVRVRGEPPRRYRQLIRLLKFHRLLYRIEGAMDRGYTISLDGPLSLFRSTQKYGLQLALFLPAVLGCADFEVRADLLWGPRREPRTFAITPGDGLVSHRPDQGMYVPAEVKMFAELFARRVGDWEIREETEILDLGGEGVSVPDFQFIHRGTGRSVFLEVLGFWRRGSVQRHLELLRRHRPADVIVGISDALRLDDEQLAGLDLPVHRFREMPRTDEIQKLLTAMLGHDQGPTMGGAP